jgi:hypothetical protein
MNPVGKFPLGHIVATPNALQAITQEEINTALSRHHSGDWGDVSEADRKENDFSLARGLRLFSVYHAQNGTKFWIITESDRSSTCILLPEDY